jgi:hypothetical protein
MTALTDLLDAHHKKLNEHTSKIKELEARLAGIEGKADHSYSFTDSVNRWVQSLKERLT